MADIKMNGVDDRRLCAVLLTGGRKCQRTNSSFEEPPDLPKAYWPFSARRSMLEHAYARIEKLVPSDRVFTVVSAADLGHPEVGRQLCGRAENTIVVQPEDRDTGPGLLLSLSYVHKRFPTSVTAVIPPEQFARDDERLTRYIRLAQAIVKHDASKVILLGTVPDENAAEFGYVLSRPEGTFDGWGTYPISRFVKTAGARELRHRGALCNSMLLVMQPQTLLLYLKEVAPNLHRHFDRIEQTIGTPLERGVLSETYSRLSAIEFSKELLEPIARKFPGTLLMLPVGELAAGDGVTDTFKKLARSPSEKSRHNSRRHRLEAASAGASRNLTTLQR